MTTITSKFWFINDIQDFLLEKGFSIGVSDLITFISTIAFLFVLLFIIDIISNSVIVKLIHTVAKRTKTRWDDFLSKRHFFRNVLRFIFSALLIFFIEELFQGFRVGMVSGALTITKLFCVYYLMTVINSFISAAHDVYQTLPRSREKSIKGYIQTAKIVVWIIGSILGISILAKINIMAIITGLAASAAIMTLVFKDTILGFVASIQLSAQDMIRLGDWIEMRSKGADGTVMDINVTTIKVLNWDNTVTMIPIYLLVSDSFINWRSMEQSQGRRIKRPFYVDINTVKYLSKEEIDALRPHLGKSADDIILESSIDNSTMVSSLTLYRVWVSTYLCNHNAINKELPFLVHYLPMTENGIPLEIYCFSFEKGFVEQEMIINEISENIIAGASIFSLYLYQRPTMSHN